MCHLHNGLYKHSFCVMWLLELWAVTTSLNTMGSEIKHGNEKVKDIKFLTKIKWI